jgi:hypothetical protein
MLLLFAERRLGALWGPGELLNGVRQSSHSKFTL